MQMYWSRSSVRNEITDLKEKFKDLLPYVIVVPITYGHPEGTYIRFFYKAKSHYPFLRTLNALIRADKHDWDIRTMIYYVDQAILFWQSTYVVIILFCFV